jgi:predicted amidohydrolase
MLAAVGQLCSTSNVARNIKIACDLVSRAAQSNAKVLFLPEATDFIAPREQVKELSQPLDEPGGFVEALRSQARASRIWVNVGVHEKGPESESGRCYNTNLVSTSYELVQLVQRNLSCSRTVDRQQR